MTSRWLSILVISCVGYFSTWNKIVRKWTATLATAGNTTVIPSRKHVKSAGTWIQHRCTGRCLIDSWCNTISHAKNVADWLQSAQLAESLYTHPLLSTHPHSGWHIGLQLHILDSFLAFSSDLLIQCVLMKWEGRTQGIKEIQFRLAPLPSGERSEVYWSGR